MYHYAGNNPVRYTDPDGNQAIEGSCALAEDFICAGPEIALITKSSTDAAAASEIATTSSTIGKLGVIGFIVLFCLCLQGDSVDSGNKTLSNLPPGYKFVNGKGIIAPNGVLIPSVDEAYKHFSGDPHWNIVGAWGKGTFPSVEESLEHHFKKHGKEVGALSVEQYVNKAIGFKQNLRRAKGPIESILETGEHTGWKYEKNGKFIILDLNKDKILSFGSIYHKED